jgi:hypothetical protein
MQKIVLHLILLRSQRTNRNRANQPSTSLNVPFLAEASDEPAHSAWDRWSDPKLGRKPPAETAINFPTDSRCLDQDGGRTYSLTTLDCRTHSVDGRPNGERIGA